MKARKSDPSSSSYSFRIVQIGNYGKFRDPVVEEPQPGELPRLLICILR
jgi:hypothetical protein